MFMPAQKNLKKQRFSVTSRLLFLIAGLLTFGILMIYDSTFIYSQQIYGKPWVFAVLQFGWVFVGLLGFLFFYFFDYKKIKYIAHSLFLFSIISLGVLAVVGVFPCSPSLGFAPCINGANRWLYLPFSLPIVGYLGFQPAELVKFSLVLYLSVQLALKATEENAFTLYVVISLITAGLVVLQPNMSTAAMIFAIATSVYYVSDFPLKPLKILIPVLMVLGFLLIILTPYRRARLVTFVQGRAGGGRVNRDLGEDYHVRQISIALGSGGFWGLGVGQSRQKYQYLPEVATDSIFAIIGEELGFIGTTALLLFYGYFLYTGFAISKEAPDLLSQLLATGITFWLGLQFVINISAMTKLIPLTGVPLPLISYGGSSMIFSLMALGVLTNISREV